MTNPFDSPEPPDSPASLFLNFWSVIFVYLGVLACCAGVGAAWGLLGNPLVAGGWLR